MLLASASNLKLPFLLNNSQNTGYPLRGYKRAQFNMFVRKVDQIDFTNKLKTFVMPIIWVEEVNLIISFYYIKMMDLILLYAGYPAK